jgi:uncharacterized membrane protein
MSRVLSYLAVAITLLFPIVLWLGESRLAPRQLAFLLLLAVLARLVASRFKRVYFFGVGGTALLVLLTLWFDEAQPLRFYPALVNGGLLIAFAYSLVVPPSIIERLARPQQADFPPTAVAYTRRVTQMWCVFFAVNGAIALYTALFASLEQWTFYNGFVAYLLMGLLFAGEYCARCLFRRRHASIARST